MNMMGPIEQEQRQRVASVRERLRGGHEPKPVPRFRVYAPKRIEFTGNLPRVEASDDWFLPDAAPYDDQAPQPAPSAPLLATTIKSIIKQVASKHKVRPVDILSIRRERAYVAARHEVFYRLKTETSMSMPHIGRAVGGRDHTTVLHGIRKHAERNGLPL